jgi:hypothetical protein
LWNDELGRNVKIDWNLLWKFDDFYRGDYDKCHFDKNLGLDSKLYSSATNKSTMMNASNAAKLFSKKNQRATVDKLIIIENILSKKVTLPKFFSINDIIDVKNALVALLPFMKIVNDWIDIYNSRDKNRELLTGDRFFRRINYTDIDILEGMEKVCIFICIYIYIHI